MNIRKPWFRKICGAFLLLNFLGSLSAAQFDILKIQPAHASGVLLYKSVDVMKWTKDTLPNQPTGAEINNIVSAIAGSIKPTHIAISVPMDASADYPTGSTPAPRSAAAFTQAWSDAIHAAGTKVLWRGTWAGIEGIYNFPKKVGANRFPAGTAASAATDGNSTWLGKTYDYIVNNPSFFRDGDIWAPLPERTENIFQDATSFLPFENGDAKASYANFFIDIKKVSDAAFAKIGKRVITGLSTNNFTEVKSSWLRQSLLDMAGTTVVDHYGSNHTPSEMDSDIRYIYAQRGKPVFLQEWGDYWNANMSDEARTAYLNSMYSVFQNLVKDGILIGFNYWGAWPGNMEGILTALGNGKYQVNNRGQMLANFFGAVSISSVPPPPPPPAVATPASVSAPASIPQAGPVPLQAANLPDGSLIKSGQTIYVLANSAKVPFTSMKVFTGLGYKVKNISAVSADAYPAASYILNSAAAAHLPGSWILYKRTVYYVRGGSTIGVPDMRTFLNNGGSLNTLLKANAQDINNIRVNLAQQLLALNDARVK